eukprot:COSAG06_NODE_562_length_14275_cov_28.599041_6_plen_64_part_00
MFCNRWVYYILEMLKKRAGDEAAADRAQMELSTAGNKTKLTDQTNHIMLQSLIERDLTPVLND